MAVVNICWEGLFTTVKKQHVGRKLFSVSETYGIVYRAVRTMPAFATAQRNGVLQEDFAERLMLAVTEVNKCAMCSYAHTKMALFDWDEHRRNKRHAFR